MRFPVSDNKNMIFNNGTVHNTVYNEDIYYNLFDWLVLCVVYVLDVFLVPLPVSYLLQL